jgi:hypothetical protein
MKPSILSRCMRNRAPAMIALYARRCRTIGSMLIFVALGTAINVHAASSFDDDFDNQDKSWKEIAIQLPGPPEPANLLHFDVGPLATQSFFVDAKSISIGSDGVVRYTLVTTSRAGARNLSYEGIRCQSMEKKLYAFGHADGTWSRSRRDQWEPINKMIANQHHAALANDFFCQNGGIAGNEATIINRLRTDRRLSAER